MRRPASVNACLVALVNLAALLLFTVAAGTAAHELDAWVDEANTSPLPTNAFDQQFDFKFEDAKYWSIGVAAMPTPLSLAAPSVAMTPDMVYDKINIEASTHGHQLGTLLTADPFMVRGNGSWWLFFEMTKPGMQIAWARQVGWRDPANGAATSSPVVQRLRSERAGSSTGSGKGNATVPGTASEACEPTWVGADAPGVEAAQRCGPTVHPARLAPSGVWDKGWAASVVGDHGGRDGFVGHRGQVPVFEWGGWVSGVDGPHLSYPHVMVVAGADGSETHYLLPMAKDMALVLYRATNFPSEWEAAATLVYRTDLNDCNMVEWHGYWYLFCGMYRPPGLYCRQILYVASAIDGPYQLHPASQPYLGLRHPVHFGRNAGRIVRWGPYLIRPAQRYAKSLGPYGPVVRAAVIRELTPSTFKEVYHPWWVLAVSLSVCNGSTHDAVRYWNGYGAHHIDMHEDGHGGWIAVTDGRESASVTKARIHYRCNDVETPPVERAKMAECRDWLANASTGAWTCAMMQFREAAYQELLQRRKAGEDDQPTSDAARSGCTGAWANSLHTVAAATAAVKRWRSWTCGASPNRRGSNFASSWYEDAGTAIVVLLALQVYTGAWPRL